jgi:hypothetical protein
MEATVKRAPADTHTRSFTGSVEAARQFFDAEVTVAEVRARLWAKQAEQLTLAAPSSLFSTLLRFVTEQSDGGRILHAIQSLYLSINRPRDRQIAERITELRRVVLDEGKHIVPESLEQFVDFFRNHPNLGFPRIFVTPNGTVRARWTRGPENFVAIEFTGKPLVRMVAEVPRDGQTAAYFASEPVNSVVAASRAVGVSFD